MSDPLQPYSTQPWTKERNHGVPGAWITGDRILDVVLLPLVFAVLFPLLRVALVKYVFHPWGASTLAAVQKKDDLKWSEADVEKKMVKWNESCWKAVVYVIFSAAAFAVSFGEKWQTDPFHFWTDANQFPLNAYVPLKVSLFYLLEIGFYIQAVPFLMFVEVRRKDWMESFTHHIVTLGLMYYSWYANFTRPGVIVMLLHDVSDIFLEGAKLSRYANKDDLALKMFGAFAVSWVILRVFIFPYLIVGRMLVDPVLYISLPFKIDPQPHYAVFGTLFMILWFLHLYWTYLIFKVIARQLATGSTDDVREDSDDD